MTLMKVYKPMIFRVSYSKFAEVNYQSPNRVPWNFNWEFKWVTKWINRLTHSSWFKVDLDKVNWDFPKDLWWHQDTVTWTKKDLW